MLNNVLAITVFLLFLLIERKNLSRYSFNAPSLVMVIIVYILTIGLVIEPAINIIFIFGALLLQVLLKKKIKISKSIFITITLCAIYLILNTVFIFGKKGYNTEFNPYVGCLELISYFLYFILLKLLNLNNESKLKLTKIISLFSVGVFACAISEVLATGVSTRIFTIFKNPNLLGIYAAIILALNILERKKVLSKKTNILIVIANALLLLLSQSRVAWIGFLAFLLVYFAKSNFANKLKAGLLLICICGIAVLLLPQELFQSVSIRVLSSFDSEDYSTIDRIKLLECAIKIFINNWLFGTGIRSFPDEAARMGYRFYSANVMHPHNAYLELAQMLGLVGVLFYALIIFKIYRKRQTNKYNMIIIMFLTFGMLNRLFNEFSTTMLLWTILAFI